MQLSESKVQSPKSKVGKPALAFITLIPLCWLLAVTMTAGVQKIWHSDPRIGFLSQSEALQEKAAMISSQDKEASFNAQQYIRQMIFMDRQTFNMRLDAAVAGIFLILVAAIVLISVREWILLLARKKVSELRETPPVWLPDYAIAEGKPLKFLSLLTLGLALLKELSGEAHLERAQKLACECDTVHAEKSPQQIYVETTEDRFKGVRRCC